MALSLSLKPCVLIINLNEVQKFQIRKMNKFYKKEKYTTKNNSFTLTLTNHL